MKRRLDLEFWHLCDCAASQVADLHLELWWHNSGEIHCETVHCSQHDDAVLATTEAITAKPVMTRWAMSCQLPWLQLALKGKPPTGAVLLGHGRHAKPQSGAHAQPTVHKHSHLAGIHFMTHDHCRWTLCADILCETVTSGQICFSSAAEKQGRYRRVQACTTTCQIKDAQYNCSMAGTSAGVAYPEGASVCTGGGIPQLDYLVSSTSCHVASRPVQRHIAH